MERSTIVRVHDGLHARPATRFVKLAKSFESSIELIKEGQAANAKSPVKLMLLGVKENDEITVRAEGADQIEAVEALVGYLENPLSGTAEEVQRVSLDETAGDPPVRVQSVSLDQQIDDDNSLRGVAASEGVCLGAVFAYFPPEIVPERRMLLSSEIPGELDGFQKAVEAVQARMDKLLSSDDLPANDRGIIAALRDIVADDDLSDGITQLIKGGLDAVSSVIEASGKLAVEFGRIYDPYLNARADDVRAIARQLCLALLGHQDIDLNDIPEGAVLVADDIGAWDLARAPLARIAGIVCGKGGATSHIAIMARSHNIPAVLGLGGQIETLRNAKGIALDGTGGYVVADPDDEVASRFRKNIEEAARQQAALKIFKDVIPKLADGTVIEVAANLGSLEEIDAAQAAGAMGVGLFRTELLFMRHINLPSEDMQAETYTALAQAFSPYQVIVRTLDIGGDKPISGIDFPHEENPFLGWRGIRMCLDRPEMFKVQLRALLRAAIHGNLKVMLPMVSHLGEVERTRVLIDECAAELKAEGVPFAFFPLGVMIETPAAVLIAPVLAREVAFFSIGTNDLTQYIMAADRLNPAVAGLNDVTNAAVMAAIEMTGKAGKEAGIMVGMCGEAAGRPDLTGDFIRMGITELSMSPASIQRVKKRILEEAGK